MQPIRDRFNSIHPCVSRGIVLGLTLVFPLSGCFRPPSVSIDDSMNAWLGKSKDERIRAVGWPTHCTRSKNEDETCEWVRRGSSNRDFDCPPDGRLAGHPCNTSARQTGEHHLSFTYDRDGIARTWTYRGSEGERASTVAIHQAE